MIGLDSAPNNPGCYLFKDGFEKIIYVGKAKNLKKRVGTYFQKKDLDPKTQVLVENIDSVDFIVTDNEVEALILENTLIKRHQPKYNINLKDSKNYAYIQLTSEDFPRLLVARRKSEKGRFFGPFVSGQERDYILSVLNKIFQLKTCRRMPKKPCLRYHISLCTAPCAGYISKADYGRRIEMARLVLNGKIKDLLASMDRKMVGYSNNLNFERALVLRNQINALSALSERQKMERQRRYDEDIINYLVKEGRVYLILFNIYKGTLTNKKEFTFDLSPEFFEEFLVQYYSENDVPSELILSKKMDGSVVKFLETKKKGKMRITVPKKGAKKELLDLVAKNIEISFFGDMTKLGALREALGLEETPHVIECFDISHLSGTSTVGSMVQFRNGRPDKSNYRRFKIKTVEGIADTAAISEVVRRRYYRLKKEGSDLPNLIVIDGGAGQLNAALKVLKNLSLSIPVVAIAKRFESIYLPGQVLPIKLDKKNKALQFI
ncbi:MAG: excinuclease ABC subunit UvrC, partial [Candidatus Hydrothermarchaeales archaeon]